MSQKQSYRTTMRPLTKSISIYHQLQLKKGRKVKDIARDFNVSGNSYRSWLQAKMIPDINNAHLIVKKLLSANIKVDPTVIEFLSQNPFDTSRTFAQPVSSGTRVLSAKTETVKSRRQVKKKAEPELIRFGKRPSTIENLLRELVRDEVQKAFSRISVKIETLL